MAPSCVPPMRAMSANSIYNGPTARVFDVDHLAVKESKKDSSRIYGSLQCTFDEVLPVRLGKSEKGA